MAPASEGSPELGSLWRWGAVRAAQGEGRIGHPKEIIQTLMKLFLSTCVNNSEENGQVVLL